MCCILKFCLILCTIPLVKAVGLKIDGLINFGENWSYEYRVLRSGVKDSPHQKENKAATQKDEEQLNSLEERLRKESVKHRNKVQKDVEPKDKQHKSKINKGLEISAISNTKHDEEDKTKGSDTSSNENSSSDSDPPEQNMATMMIYDETTKKTKKHLRFRDYSETKESSYASGSSERSASWKDKTRHATTDDDAAFTHDTNINIVNHMSNPRAPRGSTNKALVISFNKTIESLNTTVSHTVPTIPTVPTTTQVTTVRTEDIYTDAHKVKDDAKITEFTNHLYKQTLKVFDTVKQKTNQDKLKSQIDRLSRSYEEKFKEFLRDTSKQKIKTRLGTQKVILNTIDMSNRILRRLMNFLVGDLDKKGVLRYNAASANIFQKTIETEEKLQLVRACKKFGICRSGTGFSAFTTDVLATLLKYDDKKFKQSIDAFTEVIKYMNYYNVLTSHTEKKLKKVIEKIEMQNVVILRAIVLILKNTITNQNKPLSVNNFSARQRIVNSTLALLEIIDLLDTKIPRSESNALEWSDMKNSFEEFGAGKRYDILEVMTALVKHVKVNLKNLDEKTQRIISKNLDMILSLELS